MKKYIIGIIIVLYFTLSLGTCINAGAASPFIETKNLSLDNFELIQNYQNNKVNILEKQLLIKQIEECAKQLELPEDHVIIQSAQEHWTDLENQKNNENEELLKWQTKFDEYPYATYVWLYLVDTLHYNDYVAAGILGNMMAEVGGGTLHIQYWLYSYGGGYFYGICQWNKTNYPEVRGYDLIQQCEYLANTIKEEIDVFGYAYANNYNYDNFLNSTSINEATLVFAKCYERCTASTYSSRQSYAQIAYNYFVGDE